MSSRRKQSQKTNTGIVERLSINQQGPRDVDMKTSTNISYAFSKSNEGYSQFSAKQSKSITNLNVKQ